MHQQGRGLKDQHHGEADAEGQNENFRHMRVVEVTEKDHGKENRHVEKQNHYRGSKEVLHELSW